MNNYISGTTLIGFLLIIQMWKFRKWKHLNFFYFFYHMPRPDTILPRIPAVQMRNPNANKCHLHHGRVPGSAFIYHPPGIAYKVLWYKSCHVRARWRGSRGGIPGRGMTGVWQGRGHFVRERHQTKQPSWQAIGTCGHVHIRLNVLPSCCVITESVSTISKTPS